MNNDNSSQPISTRTSVLTRRIGALVLVLIFLASGTFTLAYLSNPAQAPQQTAAAAEPVTNPFDSITLQAKSAYVYDLKQQKTLLSLNSDAQLPLASLTKIMLVLAVDEVLSPDSSIVVPAHTPPDGGAKRIPDGSTWRTQDLIDFTLVSSSNEGAEILAMAADSRLHARYPGSAQGGATLYRMNSLARQLGLTHTYFLNVSGLDLSPTQSGAYGSSRDIATLFSYAYHTDPAAFEGTAESGLLRKSEEGDRATAVNTDKALGDIPGVIMGKTGLTDLAGGNLGIVFDAGPAHPIVAVVLGSSDAGRFQDMHTIVETAETMLRGN